MSALSSSFLICRWAARRLFIADLPHGDSRPLRPSHRRASRSANAFAKYSAASKRAVLGQRPRRGGGAKNTTIATTPTLANPRPPTLADSTWQLINELSKQVRTAANPRPVSARESQAFDKALSSPSYMTMGYRHVVYLAH